MFISFHLRSWHCFSSFFQKTENVDYEFVLTRASPGQLSDLWSSWYLWIAEDALALVGLPTESEGPDTEKKALALSRISVLIPLAKWTVQLPIWKSVPEPIPDHLRQSCHLLHLILASPTLASSEEPFKNAISLLCETWYSQKLDGWEELIPNAMTFLLKRSLSDHGTVSSNPYAALRLLPTPS